MNKMGGGGLIIAAIILVFLGLVLRMDLIDWLIDITGFILILGGIVLGIVGVFNLVTSGNKS